MTITDCGLGSRLISVVNIFLLWTAAVLLGVKYKMTALKIHSAVVELNVVNRLFYREVFIGFGCLYLFSFGFFIFEYIAVNKILKNEWPLLPQ
jgi:hypothetical protein